MDQAALYTHLRQQRYGVVSSLSGAGTPQSALVGIAVTPELEIVFDMLRSSRKFANLTARPACSFVIGGWSGEQTAQYEGSAFEPSGVERTRYQEIYFEVWPGGRERMQSPGITHLVVRPSWIRYSDFEQRPPLIQEFTFPLPA
jgi:hypothetical protein